MRPGGGPEGIAGDRLGAGAPRWEGAPPVARGKSERRLSRTGRLGAERGAQEPARTTAMQRRPGEVDRRERGTATQKRTEGRPSLIHSIEMGAKWETPGDMRTA
ncbi:hypothetical protein NDU88_003348 [Pleurodeles waltl]|uniref:Uncharacterized protein n=1 Tax=Pleurodeles waltl TaxID=8319 RepID=A0AAV7TNT3_PLEWA|nr:hypothetical protein NDU88_003348 [Pleurodeles waltl]